MKTLANYRFDSGYPRQRASKLSRQHLTPRWPGEGWGHSNLLCSHGNPHSLTHVMIMARILDEVIVATAVLFSRRLWVVSTSYLYEGNWTSIMEHCYTKSVDGNSTECNTPLPLLSVPFWAATLFLSSWSHNNLTHKMCKSPPEVNHRLLVIYSSGAVVV